MAVFRTCPSHHGPPEAETVLLTHNSLAPVLRDGLRHPLRSASRTTRIATECRIAFISRTHVCAVLNVAANLITMRLLVYRGDGDFGVVDYHNNNIPQILKLARTQGAWLSSVLEVETNCDDSTLSWASLSFKTFISPTRVIVSIQMLKLTECTVRCYIGNAARLAEHFHESLIVML